MRGKPEFGSGRGESIFRFKSDNPHGRYRRQPFARRCCAAVLLAESRCITVKLPKVCPPESSGDRGAKGNLR